MQQFIVAFTASGLWAHLGKNVTNGSHNVHEYVRCFILLLTRS